jgi:hypothetical protein
MSWNSRTRRRRAVAWLYKPPPQKWFQPLNGDEILGPYNLHNRNSKSGSILASTLDQGAELTSPSQHSSLSKFINNNASPICHEWLAELLVSFVRVFDISVRFWPTNRLIWYLEVSTDFQTGTQPSSPHLSFINNMSSTQPSIWSPGIHFWYHGPGAPKVENAPHHHYKRPVRWR